MRCGRLLAQQISNIKWGFTYAWVTYALGLSDVDVRQKKEDEHGINKIVNIDYIYSVPLVIICVYYEIVSMIIIMSL